jgi:hypothetical protein
LIWFTPSSAAGDLRPQPQETNAKTCHMATRFDPVGVGHLERYVATREHRDDAEIKVDPIEPTAWRSSAGPSGLVAAGALARPITA